MFYNSKITNSIPRTISKHSCYDEDQHFSWHECNACINRHSFSHSYSSYWSWFSYQQGKGTIMKLREESPCLWLAYENKHITILTILLTIKLFSKLNLDAFTIKSSQNHTSPHTTSNVITKPEKPTVQPLCLPSQTQIQLAVNHTSTMYIQVVQISVFMVLSKTFIYGR